MVVNVWAQWCPPCRAEAPHLADVAEQAGDKVRIIGIDFDDPQPGYAIEFAQLAGWHYPQLVDRIVTIEQDPAVRGSAADLSWSTLTARSSFTRVASWPQPTN